MELALYNQQGQETGRVTLNDEVFAIEPNEHALYSRGTMYYGFERHAHEETCNLFKKEGELHA